MAAIGRHSFSMAKTSGLYMACLMLRRQVGGGPHSFPRKSIEPSEHLQSVLPLGEQRSSDISISFWMSDPSMSVFIEMLKTWLPAE